jgi:hypothetical protein
LTILLKFNLFSGIMFSENFLNFYPTPPRMSCSSAIRCCFAAAAAGHERAQRAINLPIGHWTSHSSPPLLFSAQSPPFAVPTSKSDFCVLPARFHRNKKKSAACCWLAIGHPRARFFPHVGHCRPNAGGGGGDRKRQGEKSLVPLAAGRSLHKSCSSSSPFFSLFTYLIRASDSISIPFRCCRVEC